MLAGLESARYIALMETLEEATRSIMVRPDQPGLKAGAVMEFKKLRKAARKLEAEHDDELMHRVRRLAKKARYSAELLQNTVGKPVSKFISKTKALQDVLGEHQDAVVAEARVREYLSEADDRLGAFALGRLVERQAARRRAARADFPDAWSAVERSGRQAWL
jgi:CHAD domain-containing protein